MGMWALGRAPYRWSIRSLWTMLRLLHRCSVVTGPENAGETNGRPWGRNDSGSGGSEGLAEDAAVGGTCLPSTRPLLTGWAGSTPSIFPVSQRQSGAGCLPHGQIGRDQRDWTMRARRVKVCICRRWAENVALVELLATTCLPTGMSICQRRGGESVGARQQLAQESSKGSVRNFFGDGGNDVQERRMWLGVVGRGQRLHRCAAVALPMTRLLEFSLSTFSFQRQPCDSLCDMPYGQRLDENENSVMMRGKLAVVL